MRLRLHTFLITGLTLVIAALVLWRHAARPLSAAALPSMEGLRAVTLVFGAKDNAPAKWDGIATLSGGSIERVAGYHFTRESKIVGDSGWQASTHHWPAFASTSSTPDL